MSEETRYTNRQIERLLDEQTGNLKAYFDMALKPIVDQTTKTNGRVNKLENWRWFLAGGLALLSFSIIVGATLIAALRTYHALY